MAKKPPKKPPQDPERRRAARIARDLYGALLGSTSARDLAAARTDFADLADGEQRFVAVQLQYLAVRAIRDLDRTVETLAGTVAELGERIERIERVAVRHDRREIRRDEAHSEQEEPDAESGEPEADPEPVLNAPELTVACPRCGAGPDLYCTTGAGRPVLGRFHAARTAAATAGPNGSAGPSRDPDEILGADGAPLP